VPSVLLRSAVVLALLLAGIFGTLRAVRTIFLRPLFRARRLGALALVIRLALLDFTLADFALLDLALLQGTLLVLALADFALLDLALLVVALADLSLLDVSLLVLPAAIDFCLAVTAFLLLLELALLEVRLPILPIALLLLLIALVALELLAGGAVTATSINLGPIHLRTLRLAVAHAGWHLGRRRDVALRTVAAGNVMTLRARYLGGFRCARSTHAVLDAPRESLGR
jgi:hypothetical protein